MHSDASGNDDLALLRSWQAGDRDAGDTLFQRHFTGLYRFFRNKLDDASAQELTQSTFLALASEPRRFEGQSSFRTYLFAIARNHLYMHFRKRSQQDRVIEFGSVSVAELGASPGSVLAARQEQQLLHEAMRRLPVDFQIALELYYWEGLSTVEVAAVLEIPEGTVRSRLTRARERLAALLEELAASPHDAATSLRAFEQRSSSRPLPS